MRSGRGHMKLMLRTFALAGLVVGCSAETPSADVVTVTQALAPANDRCNAPQPLTLNTRVVGTTLEGSHDFKQIVSIFNSMPREELFWTEAAALHKDIRAIMEIQRQHKVPW